MILDAHNRARQVVALGQIVNQPPAQNMEKMVKLFFLNLNLYIFCRFGVTNWLPKPRIGQCNALVTSMTPAATEV